MPVESTAYNWASPEDIPGSRCEPRDNSWPRSYQVLSEPELWRELRILAKPQSFLRGEGDGNNVRKRLRADCVNFQPAPRVRTQDRYVVRDLEVCGRRWTLAGVFDGHLGEFTVEHVAEHLPPIIQDFVCDVIMGFTSPSHPDPDPAAISRALERAMIAFDETLSQDVLDLFGGSMDTLSQYSDEEVRAIVNDQHEGGANWRRVRLCMCGTTALVTLFDPDRKNLWVANLGDCQAVIVSQLDSAGIEWTFEKLTNEHNGDNDAEVERVQLAHLDEPECIVNRRVLGALAPTRCIGDIPFKLPQDFTRRVIFNLYPGFHDTSAWEEFLQRNKTPPYITALPEVTHRKLDNAGGIANGASSLRRFLVLTSDGFADVCGKQLAQQRVWEDWARGLTLNTSTGMAIHVDRHVQSKQVEGKRDNMALQLLKEALGGADRQKVSRVLTLDMDDAWVDDTTIVVLTL